MKPFLPKMMFPFIAMLLCAPPAFSAKTLVAQKVATPPVVDGVADDAVWSQAAALTVPDAVAKVDVTLKAVYTEDRIFFLATYPDADESRLHKPWVWNKDLEVYQMGPQREDNFAFKWNLMDRSVDLSNFSDDLYRADVWYWKANRTDPAGYSDDKMHVISAEAGKKAQPVTSKGGSQHFLVRLADEGEGASDKKVLLDYQGDVVDQFTPREPSGSHADIKAKGHWQDGLWTIEFARKLDTGHDDDVQFSPVDSKDYLFGISVYGLYGEPLDDSQPTRYGQGRISEPLHLQFAR